MYPSPPSLVTDTSYFTPRKITVQQIQVKKMVLRENVKPQKKITRDFNTPLQNKYMSSAEVKPSVLENGTENLVDLAATTIRPKVEMISGNALK